MQLNKNRPEYAKQCHCTYCVNFFGNLSRKSKWFYSGTRCEIYMTICLQLNAGPLNALTGITENQLTIEWQASRRVGDCFNTPLSPPVAMTKIHDPLPYRRLLCMQAQDHSLAWVPRPSDVPMEGLGNYLRQREVVNSNMKYSSYYTAFELNARSFRSFRYLIYIN